ncbi:hypothetical protein CNMCM5793_008937 [Aspergillus hiratsukae]|uniref:Uncharacterized protein n=1 Tax=Aspergillus hiratsukae TaxID=1194566 RepID=A0A8H6P893_9EURO|nr:hypothetical protein CNMCM5793_008937 [Aspergillus hiratsukae]
MSRHFAILCIGPFQTEFLELDLDGERDGDLTKPNNDVPGKILHGVIVQVQPVGSLIHHGPKVPQHHLLIQGIRARDCSNGTPADGLPGGPGARGVIPALVVVVVVVVVVSLAVRLRVLERITIVIVSVGVMTVIAREAV